MTVTAASETPAPKVELTLEQLTDLVGEACGWNDRANITFRREINRESVPHWAFVSVSVSICGSGVSVSASGSDHRKALIALLQNIEMHHREILRWHKQRCVRAREILDEHAIYYVKGDL
jgi:phosphotransferase system HPr-like phosphotransfer protein